MTLLYCDGFDSYATAELNRRYALNASPVIDASVKRNGIGALALNSFTESILWSYGGAITSNKCVVGFAFRCSALPSAASTILQVAVPGGNYQVKIQLLPAGNIRFVTAAVVEDSTAQLVIDTWYHIELEFECANSTASECYVAIDGVVDITVATTSDTQSQAGATIGDISLESNSIGAATYYFDDFYVCDQEGSKNNSLLGDSIVETVLPDGNGYNSDFDGSDGNQVDNFELVDEATPDDDTTYVEDDTVDGIDTFTFAAMSGSPITIHGVAVNMQAKKTTENAKQVRNLARPDSTDYEGVAHTLSTAYQNYQDVWEDNPEDDQAWEVADVDGSEFGVTVEA